MKEIKEARLKAGLTQKKMAELLGIPKRTIEEWEGGRMRCPGYTQKMIVEELKRMNKYTEQKENLEKQNWHIYKSEGGKSFFTSKDISGIIVEVDQVTGETTINKGCPDDYFQKNKPVV